MKNIIGKKYISTDNSYTVCINGKQSVIIAACPGNNWQVKELSIVTQPFKMPNNWIFEYEVECIIVSDGKFNFVVMFDEKDILSADNTIDKYILQADKNRNDESMQSIF